MASYLLRNSPVPTSEKKFTFSTWFKLSAVSGSDNGIVEWYKSSNERYQILIDSSTRQLRLYSVEGGTVKANIYTDMAFRDVNAWYHIVIHSDTTQSSSSNAFKLWVNGVAQTFSSYSWNYSQNANVNVFDGSSTRLNLGVRNETFSNFINGYLADTYYIDGSLIAHTQFGETDSTSGIWKPKLDPTISSFGNAGVHLKYENSGTIGLDSSGNTNNFSTSGTITQAIDTPSNVFATFNPLDNVGSYTFANGNTKTTTNSTNRNYASSTLGISTGKWYMEIKCNTGSGFDPRVGIFDLNDREMTASNGLGTKANEWSYEASGSYRNNGSTASYGDTYASGDIIGIALDLDNNALYFSKNGTFQNSGDPTSGASKTGALSITANTLYGFAVGDGSGSGYIDGLANFGNGYFGTTAVSSSNSDSAGLGLFEYSVPTGYYSLCTKNIKNYG